jgi:hypothetical protein
MTDFIINEIRNSLSNPKTTTLAIIAALTCLSGWLGFALPAGLEPWIFKGCVVLGLLVARDQRNTPPTDSTGSNTGAKGAGLGLFTQTALALVMLGALSATGVSQINTTLPTGIPPLQLTAGDSALAGNEMLVWLWGTEERALVPGRLSRVRLAGLDAVDAAGQWTSIIAAVSRLDLDDVIKAQPLLVKPLAREAFWQYDAKAQPKPKWERVERFVVQAWLVNFDKNDRAAPGDDLAEVQLRKGFVVLGRLALTELSHFEYPAYLTAQTEAQKQRRGIWAFVSPETFAQPFARPGGTRQPMPRR